MNKGYHYGLGNWKWTYNNNNNNYDGWNWVSESRPVYDRSWKKHHNKKAVTYNADNW